MPPKSTQSLDELRAQARRTFRYWPIYLMLRLREVEQHLTPQERTQLGAIPGTQPLLVTPNSLHPDTAILVEYGLLDGSEDLPEVQSPPPLELPPADDYLFRVGTTLSGNRLKSITISLDFVALLASQPLRVELMRVREQDSRTLQIAGEAFTQMSTDISPQAALEAARLWAVLHGSRLLDWSTIPAEVMADFLPTTPVSSTSDNGHRSRPLPPHRRRGRGLFRDPN